MEDNLQLVKVVMKAVAENQAKEEILSQAKEAKAKISSTIRELQQAMVLLDNIVATFVPDLGNSLDTPKVRVSLKPSTFVEYAPTNEHIFELAEKFTSNGSVETSSIITQLRSEGDDRPDRSLAISVGNILARNGWESIAQGLYRKKEVRKTVENK